MIAYIDEKLLVQEEVIVQGESRAGVIRIALPAAYNNTLLSTLTYTMWTGLDASDSCSVVETSTGINVVWHPTRRTTQISGLIDMSLRAENSDGDAILILQGKLMVLEDKPA